MWRLGRWPNIFVYHTDALGIILDTLGVAILYYTIYAQIIQEIASDPNDIGGTATLLINTLMHKNTSSPVASDTPGRDCTKYASDARGRYCNHNEYVYKGLATH